MLATVANKKISHLLKCLDFIILFRVVKISKPADITLFAEGSVQPIRRSRTLCPVWSRRHSGTAEPGDSGREGRRWAGSPAGGRSCGGSDCMYTHGGSGGCRGDPAQVSAGFTHTHRWNTGYSSLHCFPIYQQSVTAVNASLTKLVHAPWVNLHLLRRTMRCLIKCLIKRVYYKPQLLTFLPILLSQLCCCWYRAPSSLKGLYLTPFPTP